jgi:hypothetical protein
MRYRMIFVTALLGLPLAAPAGEVPSKTDFADLSRLLHKMVVKKVPREHEEFFNWGATIPIPEKLRLPNLRTKIKVGDHLELPHGAWKRIRVKLDEPNKDLKIKVMEFCKLDKGIYRVVIDSEATVRCDGEWNQWQKGLLLLKVDGQADATIAATMVCDVDVSLNLAKFPPEINVNPKILDLKLDLTGFNLNRLGGTLEGEKFRQLGNDLMRDGLRDLIKGAEPLVKDYANKAIAEALKENQGKLAAGELLKAVPKENKSAK